MLNLIKRLIHNKIIRFYFTGGINTAFGYGVFALFIVIGFSPWIATAISTIMGILFNYKSYSIIVFNEKTWKKIVPFIAVYALIYILNNGIIIIFGLWGVKPILAGLSATIPLALVSYLLNKRFVFR
ncbi:MAG: GtrA family protein [Bacteroidetes bacterium]|nr:GtrA family protein [Bacteroidota bacterium]